MPKSVTSFYNNVFVDLISYLESIVSMLVRYMLMHFVPNSNRMKRLYQKPFLMPQKCYADTLVRDVFRTLSNI